MTSATPEAPVKICKDCGKRIYWVDDLGVWYHWYQVDMLICPAARIIPAEAEV